MENRGIWTGVLDLHNTHSYTSIPVHADIPVLHKARIKKFIVSKAIDYDQYHKSMCTCVNKTTN